MQIEEILYHQTLFSNSGTKCHLTSWCLLKIFERMVFWCHFHFKCSSIKQLSCFISSGTKGRKQTLSRMLRAKQILRLLVLYVKRPTRLLPVRCRWSFGHISSILFHLSLLGWYHGKWVCDSLNLSSALQIEAQRVIEPNKKSSLRPMW